MRGTGLKLIVVVLIAIALQLPLLMIGGLVAERGARLHQAARDVAESWTGPQRIAAPVLQIDYEVVYDERIFNAESGKHELQQRRRWETAVLLAETAALTVDVETGRRWRGLFPVPVYTARMAVSGRFDLDRLRSAAAGIEHFSRWADRGVLNVAVGDPRGIAGIPALSWRGAPLATQAGSRFDAFAGTGPPQPTGTRTRFEREIAPPRPPTPHGGAATHGGGSGGVHAAVPLGGAGSADYAIEVIVRGSRALELLPLARATEASMRSDWPHPKFAGAFLPVSHDIDDGGFTAQWQSTVYASNADALLQQCLRGDCAALVGRAQSVEFYDPVNIYLKTSRAVKYGLLFVVLTFMGLVAVDLLGARAIHPLQYAFTGLATGIFFLLLLALSEHIGFDWAYLAAASACAILIGAYTAGATARARLGLAFGVTVAALYVVLYLILLAEDFALLAGTLLLFAVLAVTMLATRRLDWYAVALRQEQRAQAKERHEADHVGHGGQHD